MNKINILVGQKSELKPVAVGMKDMRVETTIFVEFIENLVSSKQKNILTITASSFPELLHNITSESEKIIELNLPENTTFNNGWRDSQSKKNGNAFKESPLTKENLEEIKKLLFYYFNKKEVTTEQIHASTNA